MNRRAAALSGRQTEALALYAEGLCYPEIGSRMGVSDGMVKLHLARARAKLGARSSVNAVAIAIRAGLLPAASSAAISAVAA